MFQQEHAVPFYITGVNGGLTEVDGLLKVQNNALLLEFQSADAIIGVVKSRVKEVSIPFDAIRRVELKKGWFTTKISIYTKSMSAMKDIPGAKAALVVLKVKRAYKIDALDLNSQIQLAFSEYKLNLLDEKE
jgi:hypothetical protein